MVALARKLILSTKKTALVPPWLLSARRCSCVVPYVFHQQNCWNHSMSSSTTTSRKNQTMYAIPPPPTPAVPVAPYHGEEDEGQRLMFPVHRIYCVARNYAEHAREMGEDPDQEPPCFFAKPPDAVVPCDASTSDSQEKANNSSAAAVTCRNPVSIRHGQLALRN